MTAVPIEAPTCWMMFSVVLARAIWIRRSVCIAPDISGIIEKPMPTPITNRTALSVQYDVSPESCVRPSVEASSTSRPGMTILPTPMRSASWPAIGITIIAPMPCGAISRPESKADSPRTACR